MRTLARSHLTPAEEIWGALAPLFRTTLDMAPRDSVAQQQLATLAADLGGRMDLVGAHSFTKKGGGGAGGSGSGSRGSISVRVAQKATMGGSRHYQAPLARSEWPRSAHQAAAEGSGLPSALVRKNPTPPERPWLWRHSLPAQMPRLSAS